MTDPRSWVERWKPTEAVKPPVPVVDVHSHTVVDSVAELVRPHFRPEDDPRTFYSSDTSKKLNQAFYREAAAKFVDPDHRVADMDAMGVDVQLVAISPLQYFYWADETLSPRAAAEQNDAIAGLVASRPRRFVGVGTLPMAHPAAAAEEARRVARDLGFPAVEIGADVNGVDLDDPRFEPLWEALEENRLVVILHPAGFTEARRLTDYYLVNVIGMPLSSTVAVTRMILGGVFERHPGLEMLVVHGGGYLPFYAARTDHAFRHRPELRQHIDRLPSEYLRRLHFDITVFDPRMVERLVADYGADRVLVGTDYPFDMGLPDPLQLVASCRLTDSEKHLILGGNAERLFRLNREGSAGSGR
jgi:aminocarboxymuconate-semialdehyde decarboxylase